MTLSLTILCMVFCVFNSIIIVLCGCGDLSRDIYPDTSPNIVFVYLIHDFFPYIFRDMVPDIIYNIIEEISPGTVQDVVLDPTDDIVK